MRHRRLLVLAILMYVTLDLSLPGMPGAFVFEHADSAEGTQARTRTAADIVAVPAETGGAAVPSRQPADYARRVAQANRVEPRGRPVRTRSFLAHVDPAPPSEDPH